MGHKDQIITQQQDKELNIDAYIARTSQTYSRLLATIDTLDTTQAQHARELEAESRKYLALHERLDQYRQRARNAEQECEDMRQAVTALIDRVERHGITSFRPASLQISSVVEPLEPLAQDAPSESNVELLNYTARIISTLQTELELEKTAHQRTKLDAAFQIADLQAKLARRDAELEAGVVYQSSGADRQAHTLSRDEALRVLELGSARNRVVQMEVRALTKRLERARSSDIGVQSAKSRLTHKVPTTRLSTSRQDSVLPDIDSIVRGFGMQVDEFIQDRKGLIPPPRENESAEKGLPEDFETSHHAFLLREKSLMDENARLKQLLDMKEWQQPSVPTGHLLEADDGEMSMELATPLVPASVLHHVDPSTVLLPPSPSPEPSLLLPMLSPSSNLVRLERELAAENQKMIDRENAVAELHHVLENIYLQH